MAWRPLAPVIRGVESCHPVFPQVAADEACGNGTGKAVTALGRWTAAGVRVRPAQPTAQANIVISSTIGSGVPA